MPIPIVTYGGIAALALGLKAALRKIDNLKAELDQERADRENDEYEREGRRDAEENFLNSALPYEAETLKTPSGWGIVRVSSDRDLDPHDGPLDREWLRDNSAISFNHQGALLACRPGYTGDLAMVKYKQDALKLMILIAAEKADEWIALVKIDGTSLKVRNVIPPSVMDFKDLQDTWTRRDLVVERHGEVSGHLEAIRDQTARVRRVRHPIAPESSAEA